MPKQIVITGPMPTPEEVANTLGVSHKELKKLRSILFISSARKSRTAESVVTLKTIQENMTKKTSRKK